MSTTATAARGLQDRNTAAASVQLAVKKPRLRHTPGGVGLGKDASRDAQRLAAAILEVLAGARTPRQAAEALGISLPRYFQVETRAMHALVASCEPRPRGPVPHPDKELAALKRQHERLQGELARQQTLVRMAQRSIGLAPVKPGAPVSSGTGGKHRRRRRPAVRALRAAAHLQQQGKEQLPAQTAVRPETQM